MSLLERVTKNILKPGYVNVATPAIWAVSSRYPIGTNVFESDWDVLIVLDTCRVDALREIAPDHDWMPDPYDIGRIMSVGSATKEWVASTFIDRYEDEISNTVYVTGTHQPDTVLNQQIYPEDDLGIWAPTNWHTVRGDMLEALVSANDYARPPINGGMHPAIITDIAIEEYRERNPDRMIVHYTQPHHPYSSQAMMHGREMTDKEEDPFTYLMQGGRRDVVWRHYIDELEHALPFVERLLDAINAPESVVTADHGDAFGEFGFYSHPMASFVPPLRWVPWAEVGSAGESDYQPTFDRQQDRYQPPEEQLKQLGYAD